MNTVRYTSIGRVAQDLAISPDVIRWAAKEVGLVPAMELNGVWHLTDDQISQLAERIDQQRAAYSQSLPVNPMTQRATGLH